MVSIGVYGISDDERNKKNKCGVTEEGTPFISFEIDGIKYLLNEEELSTLKDLILYHDKTLNDFIEQEEE